MPKCPVNSVKAGVIAGLLFLAASPALAGTCWRQSDGWYCNGGCQITHWSYDAYGRPWAHWDCPTVGHARSPEQDLGAIIFAIVAFFVIAYAVSESSSSSDEPAAAQLVPQQLYTEHEYRAHEAQHYYTTQYWLAAAEYQRLQIAQAQAQIHQLTSPPAYQQLPPPTTHYLPAPEPQPQQVPPAAQAAYQHAAAHGIAPAQLGAMLANLPEVTPETRAAIVRLYSAMQQERR